MICQWSWARRVAVLLFVLYLGVTIWGCSGPQPLSVAIRPVDEQGYRQSLNQHPQSPRDAYFTWKLVTEGGSIETIARDDAQLSATKNPFDAHRDPVAVSRGAVVYKAHCLSCHGENVDGRGVAMLEPIPKMDFHTFGKRFASTLHRGAPKAWFRKISEGYTSKHINADGSQSKMPAMGETLAREQIWLAITYLQSLDMHAVDSSGASD